MLWRHSFQRPVMIYQYMRYDTYNIYMIYNLLYLSMYLPIFFFLCLYIYLSIHLPINPYMWLSIHLSVRLELQNPRVTQHTRFIIKSALTNIKHFPFHSRSDFYFYFVCPSLHSDVCMSVCRPLFEVIALIKLRISNCKKTFFPPHPPLISKPRQSQKKLFLSSSKTPSLLQILEQ